MAVQTKNSRLDIRLDPNDKKILESAASLKRISLSSYILAVAIEAAKTDLERNETLRLNNRQRDLIVSLLDNPPEPNDNLKGLFK